MENYKVTYGTGFVNKGSSENAHWSDLGRDVLQGYVLPHTPIKDILPMRDTDIWTREVIDFYRKTEDTDIPDSDTKEMPAANYGYIDEATKWVASIQGAENVYQLALTLSQIACKAEQFKLYPQAARALLLAMDKDYTVAAHGYVNLLRLLLKEPDSEVLTHNAMLCYLNFKFKEEKESIAFMPEPLGDYPLSQELKLLARELLSTEETAFQLHSLGALLRAVSLKWMEESDSVKKSELFRDSRSLALYLLNKEEDIAKDALRLLYHNNKWKQRHKKSAFIRQIRKENADFAQKLHKLS